MAACFVVVDYGENSVTMKHQTNWLTKAKAAKPLDDFGDLIARLIGDPQLLAAIAFERETGTNDLHLYRKALGFTARSNPDGAKAYTEGTDEIPAVFAGHAALKAGIATFTAVATQVRHLRWKPSPLKVVRIPKKDANGKIYGYREIGIPTWEDRIVLEAVRQILERVIDPILPTNQHGYRATKIDGVRVEDKDLIGNPRGAPETVLKAINRGRASGYHYIQECDVVNAFPSVSRSKLRKMLIDLGASKRVAGFLVRCSGVTTKGTNDDNKQLNQVSGIAMGSAISPILWNIFSMGVLDFHHGEILVHGYADDFWIQSRTMLAHNTGSRILEAVADGLGVSLQWGGDRNQPTDLRVSSLRVLGGTLAIVLTTMGDIHQEGNLGGNNTSVVSYSEDTDNAVSSTAKRVSLDSGATYPLNPRTDSSTGTSGGCLADPCYRAEVGNPITGAVPLIANVKGAASAVLNKSVVPGPNKRLEINLPPWAETVRSIPTGVKPASVLKQWWNKMSARLPKDVVQSVVVRIPLQGAEQYLSVPGILGEAEHIENIGDDHWVRFADYIDGQTIRLKLRRKRKEKVRRSRAALRDGWHIVLRSKTEGAKYIGSAVAVFRPRVHRTEDIRHLVQPVKTIPVQRAQRMTALAAQAEALAQVLCKLETGSKVTVWTNQKAILDVGTDQSPPRPAEMHMPIIRIGRTLKKRELQVRMQKCDPNGQFASRLILRWAGSWMNLTSAYTDR
jgi:hypothetical protein